MSDVANRTTRELKDLLRELTSKQSITQAVAVVESGDRSLHWVGAEGVTASGSR